MPQAINTNEVLIGDAGNIALAWDPTHLAEYVQRQDLDVQVLPTADAREAEVVDNLVDPTPSRYVAALLTVLDGDLTTSVKIDGVLYSLVDLRHVGSKEQTKETWFCDKQPEGQKQVLRSILIEEADKSGVIFDVPTGIALIYAKPLPGPQSGLKDVPVWAYVPDFQEGQERRRERARKVRRSALQDHREEERGRAEVVNSH